MEERRLEYRLQFLKMFVYDAWRRIALRAAAEATGWNQEIVPHEKNQYFDPLLQ